MESCFNKGYHLGRDDWCNSVSVTEYVPNKKMYIYIYIMGTVKGDRKWNPKQAIKEKLKVGPEATCGESVTEI